MPAPRRPSPLPGDPSDARDAVCRTLAAQAAAFPLLNPTALAVGGLDAREAALAHAIHDAVIRRWLTLSFLIETASGRAMADLEPPIRAVLLAGAAQLALLDRIPAHAAIDESVEWAKRRIRPKAAGIVNAILRRTSELVAREADGAPARRQTWTDADDELPLADGSARVLTRPIIPSDPVARLSILSSVPVRVLERWHQAGHAPRPRAAHALAMPPTILNTGHAAHPLPASVAAGPHDAPGHHLWAGAHHELAALLASRADIWVQDPSSSASVELAHGFFAGLAAGPRVIADVCAGQGTKTRQLAALFPEAEILATDTDAERLTTLAGVFKDHPRVRAMPRADLSTQALGRCDLVLLDVPCSNTGVLPRRPEARYRLTDRTLERMADVQRQIGADAIPLLAPKGRILYSTCSLEPEENDQMAAWFTRWHSLRAQARQAIEPAGLPGDPPTRYRDGSFAVLLGR